MPTRQFLVLTGAVYLVTGLLAFATVLSVGFLGDDWFFLDVIAKADNALVSFAVFNARFTRPIVAFTYYLNYRYFGLWPVPAHLAAVLLHVFNAWLVCVLTLRLAPRPRRLMGFGAGLIFLLFAGHSEAVAWVAGMADAAVVPFLIGALLLFDRALDAGKPGRWMASGWIVGACGLLGKETAMVLPALAGAFGMSVLHAENWRRRLTRTAIFAGGAALVCAGYWLFRAYRFGSALGAYSGMGTSEGQRIGVARMFILRTFVPPGRVAVYLWVHHLDLVLLAAVATAAGIVAFRDSQSRRVSGAPTRHARRRAARGPRADRGHAYRLRARGCEGRTERPPVYRRCGTEHAGRRVAARHARLRGRAKDPSPVHRAAEAHSAPRRDRNVESRPGPLPG